MSYVVLNTPEETEYDAFQPLVKDWFGLKARDGRVSPEAMAACKDDIAEYRMLAKIKPEPLDVFYAEVGPTIEALYGKPMIGKNLNELYNDWFRKRAREGYRLCLSSGLPVYERRTFSTIIVKIGYHKLHLPLYTGDDIKDILTYIIPLDRTWKKREDWEKLVKLTPWL